MGKFNIKIFIQYNPYTGKKIILIDGKPPKATSSLNDNDKNWNNWLNELPFILSDECNAKNFDISFRGTLSDAELIKRILNNANQKSGLNFVLKADCVDVVIIDKKVSEFREKINKLKNCKIKELKVLLDEEDLEDYLNLSGEHFNINNIEKNHKCLNEKIEFIINEIEKESKLIDELKIKEEKVEFKEKKIEKALELNQKLISLINDNTISMQYLNTEKRLKKEVDNVKNYFLSKKIEKISYENSCLLDYRFMEFQEYLRKDILESLLKIFQIFVEKANGILNEYKYCLHKINEWELDNNISFDIEAIGDCGSEDVDKEKMIGEDNYKYLKVGLSVLSLFQKKNKHRDEKEYVLYEEFVSKRIEKIEIDIRKFCVENKKIFEKILQSNKDILEKEEKKLCDLANKNKKLLSNILTEKKTLMDKVKELEVKKDILETFKKVLDLALEINNVI